jgi:hypothetical protein
MTVRNPRSATRCPRTAQQGATYYFSADRMTLARLDWMKHAAKFLLGADASNSTVVRRALEHYQGHFEGLISPRTSPEQIDLERLRLIAANRGNTKSIPAELLSALPVRKLTDIAREHLASKPRVIDTLRTDLDRWNERSPK